MYDVKNKAKSGAQLKKPLTSAIQDIVTEDGPRDCAAKWFQQITKKCSKTSLNAAASELDLPAQTNREKLESAILSHPDVY